MSAGKIGMISDVITVSDGVALSHPSESFALYGQSEAENTLLKAFNSGQLAHAWLISGQKGIGKATLAYRFARFLLPWRETFCSWRCPRFFVVGTKRTVTVTSST